MSITASIEALWDWPREGNFDFASLLRRTYEASMIHERKDGDIFIAYFTPNSEWSVLTENIQSVLNDMQLPILLYGRMIG